MHPALSIIVFTTLTGLGYGLAAVLGAGLLDASATATRVAHLVALAMISTGLLSSTLHLGSPRRAWRAFSQWRSSWLSREGLMAVLTFVPLVFAAWASVVNMDYLPVVGVLGAVGALGTVFCTAMIYGSLRSVQAWHSRLTPASFLLISLTGGLILASAADMAGGGNGRGLAVAAIGLLAASAGVALARRRLLADLPLSTPESATGLGFIGRVRLFESPHTGDNYLTREMGFKVARKHAAKLARLSFFLGYLCPAALLAVAVAAIGPPSAGGFFLASAAAATHICGVLLDRWLFFAEARHAVMNYYGG